MGKFPEIMSQKEFLGKIFLVWAPMIRLAIRQDRSKQVTAMTNEQAIFSVVAEHDASTLSRILDFFALNGFVPAGVNAHVLADRMQYITVRCPGVTVERARVIQQKIQQIITVRSAELELQSLAA